MLSCKNCGAQMSGTDLVCKNCGTPWGKKHKSRKGIYLSILILILVGGASYIFFIPAAKENFLNFYNNILVQIQSNKGNTSPEQQLPEPPVTPPPVKEPEPTPPPKPVEEKEPPKEIKPPKFSWVSASSSLKSYSPGLSTDGKFDTAWLEGVKGNGIGEWIMYSDENDQTVSSITLFNGYLKNDKVYINNGRIKKMALEFSDGEVITKTIPKTSFSNAKKGFVVKLEKPKTTTSVKVTILDVYPGAYYKDTGITGISFK